MNIYHSTKYLVTHDSLKYICDLRRYFYYSVIDRLLIDIYVSQASYPTAHTAAFMSVEGLVHNLGGPLRWYYGRNEATKCPFCIIHFQEQRSIV